MNLSSVFGTTTGTERANSIALIKSLAVANRDFGFFASK
jgi:hypothetical protein